MTEIQPYYPVFLNLRGRLCIVVGGGKVAERKVGKLIDCSAFVRVISPNVRPQLETWAENGRIEWVKRNYEPGDVVNAWLVFAATSDEQINRLVWVEAEEAGRLANICDSRDLCSFIVPATIRHGALQVAISTSGTNPAAAGGLRQILESDLRDGTNHFQKEIMKYND